jgi:putative oxidoreductase
MEVMGPTGWLKFIGLCEVLGGAFVLYRGTVPIGLVFLAPVTVNILLFSFLVAGGGAVAVPGLVILVLELILFYGYRGYFADILTRHAQPTT